MIHLKGCQRCGGDTNENSDQHGQYMECLQCGAQTYCGFPTPDPTSKDGWRMKNKKGKL